MGIKGWTKPFCVRGHSLSGDNVKLHQRASGYIDRICKTCSRENAARWRSAHPEIASVKKKRQLGLLPPAPPRTHFNCGHLYVPENTYSYVASKTNKTVWSCRECALDKNRRKAGQSRENHLKRNFGVDSAGYDEILASQGGVCANPKCKSPKPGGMGAFHFDHDHSCCPGKKSCGKCIRGLLCQRCNSTLGRVKDDPEILQGLIDYLKEHNGQH